MNQFKSILVGIDFSARSGRLTEGARSVVLQALRLSRETGAKLQFLYSKVRDTEEEQGDELDISAGVGEWHALCIEGGLKDPEYVESEEAPWLAFIHRVLSGGYDLVMVAKRNRTRRMDQQMGSVSMKLVRKCPCPVWVVNPSHEHDDGPILAATDLREVGNHGVALAASLAKQEERDLYIVHAWQIPFELQVSASRMTEEEYKQRLDEEAEKARCEVRALPGVGELGERAHAMIALGAPSTGILAVERKIEPCLTVMGTVGRGGIPGFLMGNTAERLIYKLESSLLVVKPDDFVCPVG
ncbi:MAG: universal stress protein [Planctomycetes bacterium]|nr:universal stress protein [Planctomycetota bacterium]